MQHGVTKPGPARTRAGLCRDLLRMRRIKEVNEIIDPTIVCLAVPAGGFLAVVCLFTFYGVLYLLAL
jgi:hypothetical protein